MGNYDLTYNLVKHLSKPILSLMYCRDIIIVMTKGKIRKLKLGKFTYFCCQPFALRTEERVVATLRPPPPFLPNFFTAKFFESFS